ncbi:hypothetical protein LEMLEM_LOCUS5274 [Lemmus lemmus]
MTGVSAGQRVEILRIPGFHAVGTADEQINTLSSMENARKPTDALRLETALMENTGSIPSSSTGKWKIHQSPERRCSRHGSLKPPIKHQQQGTEKKCMERRPGMRGFLLVFPPTPQASRKPHALSAPLFPSWPASSSLFLNSLSNQKQGPSGSSYDWETQASVRFAGGHRGLTDAASGQCEPGVVCSLAWKR